MGKRILFIAPDQSLARDVAAELPEAAPDTHTVRSENEALASIAAQRPAAVVALDMPSRSALGLCNAVRRAAEGQGVPVVVVYGAQLGDSIARHQKLPTRADAYLPAPTSATAISDALRPLLGLAPAAEISLVPPEPMAVPAAPKPAAPPPVPVAALKPAARPSGTRDAITPPASVPNPPAATAPSTPSAPAMPAQTPVRKESGVMPAVSSGMNMLPTRAPASELEATRLRREVLELTRRTSQLQARLAEAEARSQSLADALETANRQRAEADQEWTEWVTSAEQLADEAWKAREGLLREKERLENELSAAQARITMLEGDLAAERARSLRPAPSAGLHSGDAEAMANAEAEARVMAAEIAAAERLARACREIRATMVPADAPADPDAARTTEWVKPEGDTPGGELGVGMEGLPEVVAAVRRLKLERDQFARQATRLAESDATIRRLLSEQRKDRAEHARAVAELESRLASRPAPVGPGEAASADALRARVAELERELSEARGVRGEVEDLQREVEFLTAEINRYAARARGA